MTISIPPVATESNTKYTPLLVGVKGFQVDVPVITNVSNDPLLPVISPDAVILVIPHYGLLFNIIVLQILIPLIVLKATKLVKPDLIIKSVAPVFDTSQNSILVALSVGVKTYVSADSRLASDIKFHFKSKL